MKKNGFTSGIGQAALTILVLGLAACASNAPAPVVGPGVSTPAPAPAAAASGLYTVKAGDTLYSIAREHGIDPRELIAMNGLENPNQIAPGQVVRVAPRAAEAGGTVVAPVSSGGVVARPIGEPGEKPQGDNLKREPKGGKESYSDQALAAAQIRPAEPKPAEPPAAPAPPPAPAADSAWIWPASGPLVGRFGEAGNKGIDIGGSAGDAVVAAGAGKVTYTGSSLRGYGKMVVIQHNATDLSVYAHNKNILVKEKQMVTQGQKIAEMGNTDADRVKLHFEIRRQGKPLDPLKHLPSR
ncbi:MAG: peptidoglycan DD-metalloendopeptidase family protein [Candidatus Accumulibacter sp.]|jgi:lipoprotein NlpD|nr:peptidoglycan DD-metalloendopeptidase family protein [Accumulibacter sp.]